ERREGHVAAGEPAQRVREAGRADAPVARVGEEGDVGREVVGVLGEERPEMGGPDLLLSFDKHLPVAGGGGGGRRPRGRGRTGRGTPGDGVTRPPPLLR